jgi:chemotaxis protein methyltransferase CheR
MTYDVTQLRFFAKYIESQIGIVYSESNYFQLEHRINDIITLLGYKGIDELWNQAQKGVTGQLSDLLLDLATNNETSFFRDPSLFEALTKYIILELKKDHSHLNKIRIWSAAGSSGQEAYSIAMAVEQARRLDPSFPDVDIFVSDFSDRILARAKEGLYSQLEVQRGLPTRLLLDYFDKEGENFYRVKNVLRDKMQFKKLNLLEPIPLTIGNFNIIFCRNVLIYQQIENKIQVVKKLLNCIDPQGYLILGAAESMLGISDQVKQIQFEQAVFFKKI